MPPLIKKRLDVLMAEKGLVETRTKAQALILAGKVRLKPTDGILLPQPPLKPGDLVPESVEIELEAPLRYVSRGGDKLEAAFRQWGLSARGKICLDVGASTGGFTDFLLQNGAQKVYAVDVGRAQLHEKIKSDPRVQSLEKTHILQWTPPWVDPGPDGIFAPVPTFAVIDVSFISLMSVLTKTADSINTYLRREQEPEAQILALIKPQFEVGPKWIKKGIVRDERARTEAIEKIVAHAGQLGLKQIDHFPCPVLGAQGNREEWLLASLP